MKKIHDQLILGTVQFGLPYGITNQDGQITEAEGRKILLLANAAGVTILDTAIAYGNSESVLGNIAVEDSWKIISKLPPIPSACEHVGEWVREEVVCSLARLRKDCLEGLLLHHPNDLFGINGKVLLDALLKLKKSGLVRKIGISIYSPDQLPVLMEWYPFDIVQAPANILDQRLVKSGWAKRLKSQGVEVHVRSAFLQGLLLMPDRQRPEKFLHWSPVWQEWSRWLSSTGISAVEACLRYVYTQPDFSKVLVGIDSEKQLQQILQIPNKSLTALPEWPEFDQRVLNPALWSTL